jgi:hypothetical protein
MIQSIVIFWGGRGLHLEPNLTDRPCGDMGGSFMVSIGTSLKEASLTSKQPDGMTGVFVYAKLPSMEIFLLGQAAKAIQKLYSQKCGCNHRIPHVAYTMHNTED